MKICIVTTMFPKFLGDYYGSFIFDEVKALADQGFEIHVVTQHNHGIPYEEIMEGIHIHRFRWIEPKQFRALVHFHGLMDTFRMVTYVISLFFNLIKIIRKYKIQIIHAHSVIPTGFMASIVSKIMHKPLFITAHGMDINNFENSRIFNYFISYSLNSSFRSIAVSEDLAKKMRLMVNDNNKIVVIRNAVDTDRFNPTKNTIIREKFNIKDEDILLLFVGYLDEFKGIFELVNAFSQLNAGNKNVKLMVVGVGPKKEDLLKILTKMGIENQVIFTGMIEHHKIHKYYQSADIFVLPSYTEGGGPPLVVMEAMACGLPIIVTNVGGMSEGIEEDVNGFIVPPKNVKELNKKLNILIENEDLRKKFGNNSFKIIGEYSTILGKKTENLINLYGNQIKNR
ncbi:glycosyltransferase [Methanobacterium petrolearium]|uniref:glycosyltransferase n=1 Tax=Methanobacterium petrolearium TaxID=710190 RepID=UPI001AE8FE7F|nr:glycosyltransferase [Methanobacterium petrolearium]MBP1945599.1 N-acetyl-alpha-D-glucosaminyl L-malate synthase BshA [Methanobacterium petrolearium]BDZ71827.1 N-acetyl-alpha-D-glucosaminyl L-malate synthase [Methanobacterium petrolearium]